VKFGHLSDIRFVSFQLDAYAQEDLDFLSDLGELSTAPIPFYFGSTSWNNPFWKGTIYPPSAPVKRFINEYGAQFNSIELNTTHYRIPEKQLVEKWKQAMPNGFKFSPKFPQSVSHRRDFGKSSGQLVKFMESLEYFNPNLGLPFFQFPTHYKVNDYSKVEEIIHSIGPYFPIAIELRDPGFFVGTTQRQLVALVRTFGVTLVHTDTAGVRPIVHNFITSDKIFVRFVATGNHKVDVSRIDAWLERLKILAVNGLKEIYFYLHEPDQYLQADMGLYLWERLRDTTIFESRGPSLISQPYQTKLF